MTEDKDKQDAPATPDDAVSLGASPEPVAPLPSDDDVSQDAPTAAGETASEDPASAAVPDTSDEPGASVRMLRSVERVDADDLRDLCGQLLVRDRQRQGASSVDDNRRKRLAEASCLTLILAPPELGTCPETSAECDELSSVLADVTREDLPEGRLCRLWLMCAANQLPADAAEEFSALVRGSLWEPFQSLALRALAFLGRRNLLADLMESDQTPSIGQVDAWLEVSSYLELEDRPPGISPATPQEPLSPQVRTRWIELLVAERELATTGGSPALESKFSRIADVCPAPVLRSYADTETRRISARATAALARAHLARLAGDDAILTGPAGTMLPQWEREYLSGLMRWVANDRDRAKTRLEKALALNPHQSCTRLALANMFAEQEPEKAIELLETAEPTREVLVSLAALLARLGRYDEAEAALSRCRGDTAVGLEAARFSWPRGRRQIHRQGDFLSVALAGFGGRWRDAEKIWRTTCSGKVRKSLDLARQLLMVTMELASPSLKDNWRREELQRRRRRIAQQIGDGPLVGEEAFFRGAAVIEENPGRTTRDFKTLLNRRTWVNAERNVGTDRFIFMGDVLARLGQANSAIRAYELASDVRSSDVSERLGVMQVRASVENTRDPKLISDAADRASEVSPDSFWPPLLAAVGLVIANDPNAARDRVDAAEKLGAFPAPCKCIRALCDVLSGTPRTVSHDDLSAAGASPQTEAVLRLLTGPGEIGEKLKAFVEVLKDRWITICPIDPKVGASHILAALCQDGRWDEALNLAGVLGQTDPNSANLAVMIQLRQALAQAVGGELEQAQMQLSALVRSHRSAARKSTGKIKP